MRKLKSLRLKVAEAESQHLAQLHLGLAKTSWLADCLAVPKGRSLVGKSCTLGLQSKNRYRDHLLILFVI